MVKLENQRWGNCTSVLGPHNMWLWVPEHYYEIGGVGTLDLQILNPHISLLFSDLSTGLRSTNALNINFFLYTDKVLTTSQPSYLNNLISVQPPRSTRSSSVVTLSRPPTISSLKITDRSVEFYLYPTSVDGIDIRLITGVSSWTRLDTIFFRTVNHNCLI